MTFRDEVREIETKLNELSTTPAEKLAILTSTQSMARNDEHALAILAIVKWRIIRKSQEGKQ